MSMMNEVARNEILSAGKDPMGLAAAVLIYHVLGLV
jgi:hypothetical protein